MILKALGLKGLAGKVDSTRQLCQARESEVRVLFHFIPK